MLEPLEPRTLLSASPDALSHNAPIGVASVTVLVNGQTFLRISPPTISQAATSNDPKQEGPPAYSFAGQFPTTFFIPQAEDDSGGADIQSVEVKVDKVEEA